jgi:cytochrome c oxidase cbb3-type subunit III
MKRIVTSSLLVAAVAAIPTVAFSLTDAEKAAAAANWSTHCVRCHTLDGSGSSTLGQKLKLKDYTKAEAQASFTDEEALKAIKEGVTNSAGKKTMNPYAEKLSEQEMKDLVAFVRLFKK